MDLNRYYVGEALLDGRFTLLGSRDGWVRILSKDGASNILRKPSIGEARLMDLHRRASNIRTLARRLKELTGVCLIQKSITGHEITNEGQALLKLIELRRS